MHVAAARINTCVVSPSGSKACIDGSLSLVLQENKNGGFMWGGEGFFLFLFFSCDCLVSVQAIPRDAC